MGKRKRKYNANLVRARHSYTFSEIAEVYQIHPRTVQSWRKQGLKVIDELSKPYLVIGEEIKGFLKEKAKKRKHRLKTGEFFCPRCRLPRKSLPDKIVIEITDRKLGKTHRQAIIKGVCEVCNRPVLLFSSDRKVQEMQEKGLLFVEHKKILIGSGDSSVNADIKRDENVKSQWQK
jgi:hypothetical protein